jgi:hypothetical protein
MQYGRLRELNNMEAMQAIVQSLYTNFLLRDFVGKIVPGAFLAISFATIFYEPNIILRTLAGRLSFVLIVLVAGFLWTITLGLQNVGETLHIWSYFPRIGSHSSEASFAIATPLVQAFIHSAEQPDRLQYERFVVIKEATGNLFFSGIIAVPFWIRWALAQRPRRWDTGRFLAWQIKQPKTLLVTLLATTILIGLYRMNTQHVLRQYCLVVGSLAEKSTSLITPEIQKPCNPD